MEGDDKISIMETVDWTMLCRVCLKLPSESEMLDLNIIYDEEEQFTYHDCFAMCTQINIGDDESMPQNLCRGCGLELQMAYDFYKKVEESKRFLSHWQEQQPEITIATTEESLQEGELEEQIDIEEYQSVEQLDEEELDYKMDASLKEDESDEQSKEILVDLDCIKDYKDYMIESNVGVINLESHSHSDLDPDPDPNPDPDPDPNPEHDHHPAGIFEQESQMKREIMDTLSESENEDDEDLSFEDLYEKVFEDIKVEQLENGDLEDGKAADDGKFIMKRRRGRPRRMGYEDIDTAEFVIEKKRPPARPKKGAVDNEEPQSQQLEAAVIELPGTKVAVEISQPAKRRTSAKYAKGPPFECEVCHYVCNSRALLNSHRFRKHRRQDSKQFPCPNCERTFHSKQQLERHMRRPTCNAYPQFDCEHCGKRCIGVSNYNIHLRFHKRQYPFVCHLCGKKFMMCVHLNEHVRVKHENKRYPCDHPGCGKLFQTRNSLYNHSYQHTGLLPYQCAYCKRGYTAKARLRFHCKKSHGIDHAIHELDRMQVTGKLPKTTVHPQ